MKRILAAALVAVALAVPMQAAHAAATPAVRVDTTYGAGTAEVTYTPGSGGAPWLLMVHGGGWTRGDLTDLRPAAATFAADGYVTVNIDYPLEPAPWTAMRDAVVSAVEWAHTHAADFGADPARGAVFGFSAGGHLALTAGLVAGPAYGVRAILVASGVVDPRRLAKDALHVRDFDEAPTPGFVSVYDRAVTLAGCGFRAVRCWSRLQPDVYAGAGDPPVLMMSGSGDRTVPPSSGRYEAGLLRGRGVAASWAVVPGLGHTPQTGLAPAAVAWLGARV